MKKSELGSDFMNIDGDVLNYEVSNGLQNIGNEYVENGLSVNDMSFADGSKVAESEDDFYDSDGDNDTVDDFYNAGGLMSNFRKNQKRRQDRRDLKAESKASLRVAKGESKVNKSVAKVKKADAKIGLSDAQKASAEAMGKGTEGDVALANALASKPQEKAGMSMSLKVGIGAGVVLVLGIIGFVVYKKMKKGK